LSASVEGDIIQFRERVGPTGGIPPAQVKTKVLLASGYHGHWHVNCAEMRLVKVRTAMKLLSNACEEKESSINESAGGVDRNKARSGAFELQLSDAGHI
jgi:hypothetical protein